MTYGIALDVYLARGWPEVLPLPPRQKTPPPAGFTGARNVTVTPSAEDYGRWQTHNADGNLALRMPANVVGIDVDAYGSKVGDQSFTTAIEAWGELPDTWRVTSRTDGISGIRFFRVPEGLQWPSIVGPGIEMVHRGHRYAVAWPSVHPETGATYVWLHDALEGPVEPPTVDALPFLPPDWIEGLTGGQEAQVTPRAGADAPTLARALDDWETDGSPCKQVVTKVAEVMSVLTGPAGSRHDQVRDRLLKVIRLGQQGHQGVGWAMDEIGTRFVDTIATERGYSTAEHEWQAILSGGVDIILGDLKTEEPCYGDRCEMGKIPSLDHLPVVTAPAAVVVDPFTHAAATAEDEVPLFADLSWLLGGTPPKPVLPTLLQREDGKSLFYRAKVNGLFGEPETAKTWLALAAIVAELEAGGRALYLDVDHNGATELAQRLVQMGADPAVLADQRRFRVTEPESAMDCQRLLAVLQAEAEPVTLAVIDSLGELIPMLGAASKDNDDVTRALRFVVKPLAHKLGATVITIDHTAKDTSNAGGYAIGGQAKKRAIDGVYVLMKVDGSRIPAPGKRGQVGLFIEKDRQGNVRRNTIHKRWGTFHLDSETNAMEVDAGFRGSILSRIEPPAERPAPGAAELNLSGSAVDETIMNTLLARVKALNALGQDASRRKIEDAMKGLISKDVIGAYITAAEEAGCLVRYDGKRGFDWHAQKDWVPAFEDLASRMTAPGTAPSSHDQNAPEIALEATTARTARTAPEDCSEQSPSSHPAPDAPKTALLTAPPLKGSSAVRSSRQPKPTPKRKSGGASNG